VNPPPRIVCVGAHIESEIVLRGLIEAEVNIVAVVTLPAGYSQGISDYCDLHELCYRHGLSVLDTGDINGEPTTEAIRATAPDYLFVAGWNRLFRPPTLAIPRCFVVGSHPSPLPEGRGRAPIPWTILLNKTESAATLFRMTANADEGPILLQSKFDIPPGSVAFDVYQRAAVALRDSFVTLYRQLQAGAVPEQPQIASEASYYAKRTPLDGRLDFTHAAEELDRVVRAVAYPYPGAYTYYNGAVVRFWATDLLASTPNYAAAPGQILEVVEGRCLVMTGDRPLWITHLTSDDPLLDPATLRAGARFGYRIEDSIHSLSRALSQLSARVTELEGQSFNAEA